MKIHAPYTINGNPVLGTYGGTGLEELAIVKDVGMNLVFGGRDLLDASTERGRFCLDNGIKVMYSIAGHVHGRPSLRDDITPAQVEIPVCAGRPLPGPGLVQIEDELVRYREATPDALFGCERGVNGTSPAAHRCGIILFWPEPLRAEIAAVKDSANLFGYYVIDDSPGNALSALRGMYRVVKDVDGPDHPVCGGYSGATTLHNFDADAADVIMVYFYPFLKTGYDRTMTSWDTQWMLTAARKKAPGVPLFGIYQGFWGGQWNQQHPLTRAEIREQIEDFVREGASGLVAFYISPTAPGTEFKGWNIETSLREEIREINREIRASGSMNIAPEPAIMARTRIQPHGFWERPQPVPGIVPAWHTLAPFDDAEKRILDAVFPPERGVDLNAAYQGKNRIVRWEIHETQAGAIGFVELCGDMGFLANCVAYATCTVTSQHALDAQLRFSSDDDAIIWFDGTRVYRHDGPRGVHFDSDIVPVGLTKGTTRILVKVCNRDGQWGFNFRFTDRDGRPLDGLRFSPEPDAR